MSCEDVLFIDYLDSWSQVLSSKWPKFLRRLFYFFGNFFGYIKNDNNIITLFCFSEDDINSRIVNNLYKVILKSKYNIIVCADLILENEQIMNKIKESGKIILEGRWIYRFLLYKITEKIAYIKNIDISDLEISVLINHYSDIIIDELKDIGEKCKILNIITEKVNKYSELEKYFEDEFGFIINVSSNLSKSLIHSDLIFNIDFSGRDLKKCNFSKKGILIQINKEKMMRENGTTICFFKLNFPEKYKNYFCKRKHFCEEYLYESLLYSKISYLNMKKKLEDDNIDIEYFIGNKGKIDFRDITK